MLACILAEMWGNSVAFVIRPCTMDRWRAVFSGPCSQIYILAHMADVAWWYNYGDF